MISTAPGWNRPRASSASIRTRGAVGALPARANAAGIDRARVAAATTTPTQRLVTKAPPNPFAQTAEVFWDSASQGLVAPARVPLAGPAPAARQWEKPPRRWP